MRLSALGTAALGLLVGIILMSGSLVISFGLAMPAMGKISRPFVLRQVSSLERSIAALEQARVRKDWETMKDQVQEAPKRPEK